MNKNSGSAMLRSLIGLGWLVCHLAITVAAVQYDLLKITSLWREVILVLGLPIEYALLVKWSQWMDRPSEAAISPNATAAQVTPVIVALSGPPNSETIQEILQLARSYGGALVQIEAAGSAGGESSDTRYTFQHEQRFQVATGTVPGAATECAANCGSVGRQTC